MTAVARLVWDCVFMLGCLIVGLARDEAWRLEQRWRDR